MDSSACAALSGWVLVRFPFNNCSVVILFLMRFGEVKVECLTTAGLSSSQRSRKPWRKSSASVFTSPIMPTQSFHSKFNLENYSGFPPSRGIEPRATDQLLKQMIPTQQPVTCAVASSQ